MFMNVFYLVPNANVALTSVIVQTQTDGTLQDRNLQPCGKMYT